MSTELKPGKKAPEFRLETTGGPKRLKDFAGQHLVLYFYPKDDTPACTQEALDFSAHEASFRKAGAVVLGVSRDPLARHTRFAAKHSLSVLLGADEAGEVTEAYGVWQEKTLYGRKYMGIVRSTFLIGPDGRIVRIWPTVKVKGHAEEVLAEIAG